MQRFIVLIICCMLVIFAGFARADLIISQIMFNMYGDDGGLNCAWEWIEVYNNGTSDVDVAGYVWDDNNTATQSSSNIASGSVPAGGVAYFYNSDQITAQQFFDAWGAVNLVAVTNWSPNGLNNSSPWDAPAIWSNYSSYIGDHQNHNNVVDDVAYSTMTPWPGSNDGVAIYIKNLSTSNDDGSNWGFANSLGSTTATGGIIKRSNAAGDGTGNHYASIVNIVADDPDISGPPSVPFGPVAPGSTTTSDVIVSNLGASVNLNVTSVNFTGTDASKFTVVSSLPTGIAPSATGTITVQYNPGSSSTVSVAVMNISSNDSSSDVLEVNLKGVAHPDSPIIITGVMFNTAGADPDYEWIEIYNTSSSPVNLSGYVVDDENGIAHTSANITSGIIAGHRTAYLVDIVDSTYTEEIFENSWGEGVNVIAAAGLYTNSGLNNDGDSPAIWANFNAYQGDDVNHYFAVDDVDYDNADPWPGSVAGQAIYLLDILGDRDDPANWALAIPGDVGTTPSNGTGGTITESAHVISSVHEYASIYVGPTSTPFPTATPSSGITMWSIYR
jgi:hypothetical protein